MGDGMILAHLSPLGGAPVDVHVAEGRIAALIPSTREGTPRLLLPGLLRFANCFVIFSQYFCIGFFGGYCGLSFLFFPEIVSRVARLAVT